MQATAALLASQLSALHAQTATVFCFYDCLEAVAAIIIRSQPKTKCPAGRILKNQPGPVSNKGILCNGAGLRAVQADDVVFDANCPVDAGLYIQ